MPLNIRLEKALTHRRKNVLEAGGAREVAVINYKLILVNNY